MKRVLSLILALVMILGTMPMAFAADQSAGEMLKAAGFVAGDENGNLMEANGITRAELAVLVAELNGVKENAKTYAIAPEFKDVKADDWFGPYVAYAAKEGWFQGDDMGNFNPTAAVSDQMMATVMLRALGYAPAWETAVSEAKAMGLPVDAAAAATMTRGEAFSTMWAVVNTPKMGSDVALGVELGKITPAAPAVAELVGTIDFAEAVSNNLVNVDFDGNVDAAAAAVVGNYTIVEKADTTKTVAVIAVTVEDGDDVLLETEALVAGKAYTVMAGGTSANFTGIKRDTTAPEVDSVKGTDTAEVTVEFDMNMDAVSVEDVANYSIDKEGTVVSAEMDGRDTVILTVEGFMTTSSKRITVENVMSADGVSIKKITKPFAPKFDKSAPSLDTAFASKENNVEVIVDFKDDHGVDMATAEDVANYAIDGLEIVSAEATYQDEDDQDTYYDRVILTTTEQKSSTNYTLEVLYMMDGSTAANATTKVLDEKFRAGSEDKDEPKVTKVEEKTFTEIHVTFDEDNALDAATALDASNYTFEDNELDVLNVEFLDEDDNGNTYDALTTGSDVSDDIVVVLTVTEMEDDESYKLHIANISDNFGNTMEDEEKETVRAPDEVKTYSVIESIKVVDLETIEVKFDVDVREASAEDATKYVIDGGVGAVKEASLGSDDATVTLTVPELTANKKYEVTVNGVENFWGFTTEDATKVFIAVADSSDTTKPELTDVDYEDFGVLKLTFSEAMDYGSIAGNAVKVSTAKSSAGALTLDIVAIADEGETLIVDASHNTVNGAAGTLTKDTDYYIIGFTTAVTDEAGNLVDYDEADEDFSTVNDDYAAADDAVECDGLSQEDGRTIHATFEGRVLVSANTVTVDGDLFNVSLDSDDDQLVILEIDAGTFDDDDKEYTFSFEDIITDVLGRAAKDEDVKIEVDNDDEDGPTIDDVKVIDKKTIEITFDEPLSEAGRYKLIDEDDDDDELSVAVSSDFEEGDDVVTLELQGSDELTGDHSYELTLTRAPEDLAGNNLEDYKDEEFSFIGSDLAEAGDFLAVKVLSATRIALVGEDDFTSVGTFLFKIGSDDFTVEAERTTGTVVDGEIVYELNGEFALNENTTYTVTRDGEAAQTFVGTLEQEAIESISFVSNGTAATGTVTVVFSSWKWDTDYTYGVGATEEGSTLTVGAVAKGGDDYTITFPVTHGSTVVGETVRVFSYETDASVDVVEYLSKDIEIPADN